MISAIVILASLAFGLAFFLAWLLRPGLREEIERPKYWFQDQLRRYDRQCQGGRKERGKETR